MTCAKHRFRTRVDALLAIATIGRKDNPGRPKTERRAYRCPDCRGWHLTSQGRKP